MNAPRDKTGHSSPKPKKTNNQYDPNEAVVPLSKIAQRLAILWADDSYINENADRKKSFDKHTNDPSLCPKEFGPNYIPSWTHAKTEYGVLQAMKATVEETTAIKSKSKEATQMLEAVSQLTVKDGDFRVHAHFDKENADNSALFTAEAPVVDASGNVSRVVFLNYNRSSTIQSEAARTRREPVVKRIQEALIGVHEGLKLKSFKGYGDLIGSKGIIICVDTKDKAVIQIAAMTPASLNKASTHLSPFVSLLHRIHARNPMDVFQHMLDHTQHVSKQNVPIAYHPRPVGRRGIARGKSIFSLRRKSQENIWRAQLWTKATLLSIQE